MFESKAVLYALVFSTVVSLVSSTAQPETLLPTQTPDQTQAARSTVNESSDEKSCRIFVQKFYDWRVSLLVNTFCSNSLKGTDATQEAISAQEGQCRVASAYHDAEKMSLDRVLSPKLLDYVKQEEDVQTKEDDVGLDFDFYLNTQDPSPKFIVDGVRIQGDHCWATVHGYDQGEQREEVTPELSKTNGRWTIDNFHYKFQLNEGKPPQNDDLIHIIRRYLGEEKHR